METNDREIKMAKLERLRKERMLEELRGNRPNPAPEASIGEKAIGAIGDAGKWLVTPSEGESIGESVPIVGPLGRRLGEGFRAGVESLAGDESYGQAYDRIRGQNEAKIRKAEEEHPVAETLKKVAGGVALPGIGGGMAGALGIGARVGGAAGTEYADSLLRQGDSNRARQGATLSGGIQAGLETVPLVKHVARPLAAPLASGVKKLGKAVEDTAGMRALKHIYGNVDKAWENTPEKEQIPLGLSALQNGIVRFGEKVGKGVERAKKVGKQSWRKVEETFGGMDELAKSEEGMTRIKPELKPSEFGLDLHKGKPSVDLDENFSLVQRNSNQIKYSKSQQSQKDTWDVIDKSTNKPVGTFFAEIDKTNGPFIRQANIDNEHAGKGVGTKVYDTLSKHYGGLESDYNSTSDAARAVYKKLGAKELPDLEAGGRPRQRIEPSPAGATSGPRIAANIREARKKIKDIPGNRAIKDRLTEEEAYYIGKGAMTPAETQALKSEYIFKRDDPRVAVLGKNGTNIVNQALAQEIKSTVKQSGVKGAEEFEKAYNTAGQSGQLARFGRINNKRMTKNRSPFSLTDYLSGGAAGAAAAAITQDPTDAGVTSFLAATANNLARNRGNSALAVSLLKLSKTLAASPEKTAQAIKALESGAIGGKMGPAIAHQIMLQTQAGGRAEEAP